MCISESSVNKVSENYDLFGGRQVLWVSVSAVSTVSLACVLQVAVDRVEDSEMTTQRRFDSVHHIHKVVCSLTVHCSLFTVHEVDSIIIDPCSFSSLLFFFSSCFLLCDYRRLNFSLAKIWWNFSWARRACFGPWLVGWRAAACLVSLTPYCAPSRRGSPCGSPLRWYTTPYILIADEPVHRYVLWLAERPLAPIPLSGWPRGGRKVASRWQLNFVVSAETWRDLAHAYREHGQPCTRCATVMRYTAATWLSHRSGKIALLLCVRRSTPVPTLQRPLRSLFGKLQELLKSRPHSRGKSSRLPVANPAGSGSLSCPLSGPLPTAKTSAQACGTVKEEKKSERTSEAVKPNQTKPNQTQLCIRLTIQHDYYYSFVVVFALTVTVTAVPSCILFR